ncbi:MAG: hypothetical protein LBE12_06495 [Planctomycetaceae bacterium]|nr:hypothetical protein [Planctomycetaceae bacterium]
MRNYCRLSSNPLATLSTINSPLSTINNLAPCGALLWRDFDRRLRCATPTVMHISSLRD